MIDFEPFDPNAQTFSPARLGMTIEEIKAALVAYRETGELPPSRRADGRRLEPKPIRPGVARRAGDFDL